MLFRSALSIAAIFSFLAIVGCDARSPSLLRLVFAPSDQPPDLAEADQRVLDAALQDALEFAPRDTEVPWRNLDTSTRGTTTPIDTFLTTTGYRCRTVEETVVTERDGIMVSRTDACRDDDGVWRRVRF